MTADRSETPDEAANADRSNSTDSLWGDLVQDSRAIAEEYREDGWDAVVLEPTDVSPVDEDARIGLDVSVSDEEYDAVAERIEEGAVTITAADVYYRPLAEDGGDRRVALAVERDDDSETAIVIPISYDVANVRSVFETALVEEELLIHVLSNPDDGWVSFSHDDPSLFLEESDVQAWNAQRESGK
ncbi:DUF7529 family protein [Natrinema halophilum]|uniref:Uncharacterized protein n=1 Tax=Natrinema halophilum TaxID=1699371 RepID=A0A7D5KTJ1_9EURY|nr:hypothetical protein [Natrinema halophilum]QLG50584.1 hypothetical protein HYG82_17905 [Natrinema halophilum]